MANKRKDEDSKHHHNTYLGKIHIHHRKSLSQAAVKLIRFTDTFQQRNVPMTVKHLPNQTEEDPIPERNSSEALLATTHRENTEVSSDEEVRFYYLN